MSPKKTAKHHPLFSYRGLLIIVAIIGGLALILIAQFGNGGQFLAARHPSPSPEPPQNFCGSTTRSYDAVIFKGGRLDGVQGSEGVRITGFYPRNGRRRDKETAARQAAYAKAEEVIGEVCKTGLTEQSPDPDDYGPPPPPPDSSCDQGDNKACQGACQVKKSVTPSCRARNIQPHWDKRLHADWWEEGIVGNNYVASAIFVGTCNCRFQCERRIPETTTAPVPSGDCDPPIEIKGTQNTTGVSAAVPARNLDGEPDQAVAAATKLLADCPGVDLKNPKGLTCVGGNSCRNSPKALTAKLIEGSVTCARKSTRPVRGSYITTAADCRGQCEVTRECVSLYASAAQLNPGDAVYDGDPFSKDPTDRDPFNPDSSDDISGLGRPVTVEDISGGFGSNFFRSLFSFF